jgi:L-asparagine oxygenase
MMTPIEAERPPQQTGALDEPVPMLYELDRDEAAAIAELGDRIRVDARNDPDAYCRAARSLAGLVPSRLAEAMSRFSDVGSDSGIFVVRGLDVGTVPPTPRSNQHGIGRSTKLAPQFAILSHVLGDMVIYEAEGTGYLMQDMVPNPAFAHRQSSQGSRQVLEAHSEQSFSPMRPDYVVLGCLRGDPNAETYVFSARDLLEHMSTKEIEYLRRPLWTTLIDDSFHPYVPDPAEVRGPFALVSGSDDDPEIRIDQELTHGMTREAQDLLRKTIDVYVEHHRGHTLVSGDVAFVDNSRAMHGRSSFQPRVDGTDRFVVRGFVVRDLRRTSPARRLGSRRIGAAFS